MAKLPEDIASVNALYLFRVSTVGAVVTVNFVIAFFAGTHDGADQFVFQG